MAEFWKTNIKTCDTCRNIWFPAANDNSTACPKCGVDPERRIIPTIDKPVNINKVTA